jgi:hypothetical protein
MKIDRLKISDHYVEVTSLPGMVLISAHIFHSFRKQCSFGERYKGRDINAEEETPCKTQYQVAVLKNLQNQYCVKC